MVLQVGPLPPTPVTAADGSEPAGRRPGAGRWLLGRLGQYTLVLLAVVALNFALPRALPGGPLAGIAGEDVGSLSTEQRQALLVEYGLDRPLLTQFGDYVAGLLGGDLGASFQDRRPVTGLVLEALPWTLLLVGSALTITAVLGVMIGAAAALRARRGRGNGMVMGVLTLDALPSFWVGMLLIVGVGVGLGALPTFGAISPGSAATGWARGQDVAAHLVLPVTTLVASGLAQIALVTRSSMLSVLGADFLEHQRARGLPPWRCARHALRNGLLPVHTVLLLEVGWLVGGSLVVETVFAYPGLGRLTFEAVAARDFPVMQGAFLLLSLTVIAMNALADLSYPLLDPRLRGSGSRRAA